MVAERTWGGPVIHAEYADDLLMLPERNFDQRLHEETGLHAEGPAFDRRLAHHRLAGTENLTHKRVSNSEALEGSMVLSGLLTRPEYEFLGIRFGQVDIGLFGLGHESRRFNHSRQDGIELPQVDDDPSDLGQQTKLFRSAFELLLHRFELTCQRLRAHFGAARLGQLEDGFAQLDRPIRLQQDITRSEAEEIAQTGGGEERGEHDGRGFVSLLAPGLQAGEGIPAERVMSC